MIIQISHTRMPLSTTRLPHCLSIIWLAYQSRVFRLFYSISTSKPRTRYVKKLPKTFRMYLIPIDSSAASFIGSFLNSRFYVCHLTAISSVEAKCLLPPPKNKTVPLGWRTHSPSVCVYFTCVVLCVHWLWLFQIDSGAWFRWNTLRRKPFPPPRRYS